MDFFSGLKKAYDSLGEEISKTFDSSQSSEDSKATTDFLNGQDEVDLSTPPKVATCTSRSPEPTASREQSTLHATPPPSAGQKRSQESSDNGGWGQWENQPLMASKTNTREVPCVCVCVRMCVCACACA